MILFCEHISIEGRGTLGSYLENSGHVMRAVCLHRNDRFPKDLRGLKAVVVLGGPMNVDEEARYPFLKDEITFLKKAISDGVPIFGICLGAQLIAKACGARVRKSPIKEVGWSKVNLTSEGMKDPLFEGMHNSLDVFQWHEDTFDLPEGAILLASSSDCPNQAFRINNNVYGFQFHVEVTKEMVESWIANYLGKDALSGSDGSGMLTGFDTFGAAYQKVAQELFKNIQKVIHLSCNPGSSLPVV